MNNISQISIFDYSEIENLGDLEKLKLLFGNINDNELCEKLEIERKNGRNDYPVRTMLNLIYAMKIFGHRSIESFRRELNRNSQLRIVCGLSEGEYKYLKSIIEGGIEPKPENVVIYATSNRRHLIKETTEDNGTVFDDLHRNETQAEKLSLSYRFGLQIFYSSLTPVEFRSMVLKMAEDHNIQMDEDLLIKEANKFQMRNGTLSGRCAEQFIKYLSNKIEK